MSQVFSFGVEAAAGSSPQAGESEAAGDESSRRAQSVSGLFRERHAELVRLAGLIVGDRATAEDVVQDVFTRLCAKDLLPSRDGVAYVRAAVLNGCRSTLRRRAVARRLSGARDLMPHSGAGSAESAEHEVILAEDRRQVLAALASLPVRRREILVLRYWLGLSEAEIASTLAISRGTVKSNSARGLAALARALGEES